jgi:hypothetical protein
MIWVNSPSKIPAIIVSLGVSSQENNSKKLGIDVSLYQGTRHSSATAATDRAGIDGVQEFLHHTNRKMTERYVKANPDRLRKVLRSPDSRYIAGFEGTDS